MKSNYDEVSKFETCIYSNRLLDKLLLLNEQAQEKIDIAEVKKAIFYAKKYHAGQIRQSGEPYYSHPLEVAYMISDYLFRTDIIVTSILHDILEDTDINYEMIKSLFGSRVATQVEDLTRVKEGHKITSSKMVESLWIQKKYDVLLVKQFDRLHNIQTIAAKSPEKIQKIIKETMSTFTVLAAYLGIRDVEEEIISCCRKFITNSVSLESLSENLLEEKDAELLSLILQSDVSHK